MNIEYSDETNKFYHNECIENYVEIFDELQNINSDKDSIIYYVKLIKDNIDIDLLNKYFCINENDKLILYCTPKYNYDLNYQIIYFEVKEYKENYYNVKQQFLYMYLIIFLILNKDDNIFDIFELIGLNYSIDIENYYDIIINNEFSFIMKYKEIKYNIPNKYLNIPTNFDKNIIFSYELNIVDNNKPPQSIEFKIMITFNEIPTFADIIKYNYLIILYTIEKMYRNVLFFMKNKNGSFKSLDAFKLYEFLYGVNCEDDIIINQIIPQFIEKIPIIDEIYNINLSNYINEKCRDIFNTFAFRNKFNKIIMPKIENITEPIISIINDIVAENTEILSKYYFSF